MQEKLGKPVGVRMNPSTESGLRAAAKAKNLYPQDLLRIAAEALVRHFNATGEVPLDMDIVQRIVTRPELERLLAVAEDQSSYGHGPPSNPTTKKRTQGAGPAARVSKVG